MTRISAIYHQGPHLEPTGERETSARGFKACNEAWHVHHTVLIRLDDLHDDWLRQALTNYAERKYGKRAG